MSGNAAPGQLVPEHERVQAGNPRRIAERRQLAIIKRAGEFQSQASLDFGAASRNGNEPFDTVRGAFLEGNPVFPGSKFASNTHVR
jgi:hypothetical protein